MGGGVASAETGRLGNLLDIPVTYYVGIPDATGAVQWTPHVLEPCEVDAWTHALPAGETGLRIGWPLWVDHRRDENGVVISSGNQIPLNADGSAAAAFFANGDQVWLDTSANAAASLASCAATAAAAPAAAVAAPTTAPEQTPGLGAVPAPNDLAVALDDLIRRVDSGDLILVSLPDADGTPHTVAIDLPDMMTLIYMSIATGETSIRDADEFVSLMARQSKLLLTEVLARRAQLSGR